MVYMNGDIKPPRDIIRKQKVCGTNQKEFPTSLVSNDEASNVSALKSVKIASNGNTAGRSITKRPSSAPLMAKALKQLKRHKGRFY